METLAGRRIFITGASRGIGLAIALRAAKDGAKVTIAAKTATPHPTLPGTIYTAAEAIEAAGGEALPLVVDVRSEEKVRAAVEASCARFGGIDVLVNNASAIQLTGTLQTPMKRFDLMHQVNTRGTFLCSQACLPELLKAERPHILNLAPPLNLEPRWFGPHVAYTMAKYGMSMCVLGMAEELRRRGVAVNGLWPKTAIATSAVSHILGGEAALSRCRRPEIMADAAHWILRQSSESLSGQLLIDEEVLSQAGVSDMSHYRVDPACAEEELLPDFFL
ncbi:MAG: NAD(P)-dependent oxidoreductase [Myxococcota bacterium]|nr:NAD(P)-dependent oxidoreductase [Myxococcota bacterium]